MVHFHTLREFSQWRICEVHLCTEYLQRSGWTLGWTLEGYWRVMSERFCVVDASALDLFWPKYATREARWTNYTPQSIKFTEIGFRDWSMMYAGLERLSRIPESVLDGT